MAQQVAAFRKQTQHAHQTLARDLDEQLNADRTALANETAAFLQNVQKAQVAMAQAQTDSLATSHANLQAAVSQLVEETTAFVKAIQTEHAAMTNSQRQKLTEARQQLASATAQLRQQAADQISAIQADTANAAAAWRQMSAARTASKESVSAEAPVAPVAEKKK